MDRSEKSIKKEVVPSSIKAIPPLPKEIHRALEALENKISKFANGGFKEAEYETRHLVKEVKQLWAMHHANKLLFIECAHREINKAHIVLDHHRGAKQLLINLLKTLSTLFVWPLLHYAKSRTFFSPVATDSSKKLDNLYDALEQKKPKSVRILTTGLATQDMSVEAVTQAFRNILLPLEKAGYTCFELDHYDDLIDRFMRDQCHGTEEELEEAKKLRTQAIRNVMEEVIPEIARCMNANTAVTQQFTNRYLTGEDINMSAQNVPVVVLDGAHIFRYEQSGPYIVNEKGEKEVFSGTHAAYHPIYANAGSGSNPLPEFLLRTCDNLHGFQTCIEYAYEHDVEFDATNPVSIKEKTSHEMQLLS